MNRGAINHNRTIRFIKMMLDADDNMQDFQTFLNRIDDPAKRERMGNILNFIKSEFPRLKEQIRWNQPMFTDHGTFIIAFSMAKNHISVAPEAEAINLFEKDIINAGYSCTKGLFRIKLADTIDYGLLRKVVAYNIKSKKESAKFWRE